MSYITVILFPKFYFLSCTGEINTVHKDTWVIKLFCSPLNGKLHDLETVFKKPKH
jgi:hypothetical protein